MSLNSTNKYPILIFIKDNTDFEKYEKAYKELKEKDKLISAIKTELQTVTENSKIILDSAMDEGLEECPVPVRMKDALLGPLSNY
mmetsp:Transcript_9358/g.8160  ORF Transcript_9358/g.8160 Transcript_9358/m.8160 type:complete len:85 (+) Transcript_9358:1056-1310(+)|eukprot:CAMPEP_0114579332 /NCGR_PEP_ID=MMETSP0125-20121206/3732_1 /TAXON_ID=485358 ORGANISM="Aristerostoma sp., Strain ATCC 50986" /NCGR_SAMPLE_ID=MMETSP0125 /ASSEMBLY_ACC=CAM_ASM_000245 /LENGTH=84 /DNA_ID=CAMNT_0001770017 /DNA_START=1051 /DNA_END=1305 /DNA_ORIENTATION=-